MAKTFRIGVLGLTHDHVWGNLEELARLDHGKLVAAADPHGPLLEKIKSLYGCTCYGDPEELLQREQLDAVYVFSDNVRGAQLAELALSCGLHVFIEKPMAATLAGAERMLAAARQSGARLMINWPFAWWPQLQHAIRFVKEGNIGDLWQVKYRAAHQGPRELGCSTDFCDWLYDASRNGAGAFMDYCCYGTVLARCLLGVPSRVMGFAGRLTKEDILVEDNAMLMMTYPRAFAMAEGSWSQIGKLTGYLTALYGTRGTLLVEPRVGGKLLLATDSKPEGENLPVPEAAPENRSGSAHFLHALETGSPFGPLCEARVCRDAQEMLEAGLLSIEAGRETSLPFKNFLTSE
ncbi:MAG: Gfo/Idh/MocA family protein [Gemmataceae bacterium]